MPDKRYVFVTGGVCSSLGKGIVASSIGALLESCGYRISLTKIDPYLNIDAGTMSPIEHGEVYVTEDGAETDLDLGNYSRFTTFTPHAKHSITTGQIYRSIIERERRGDYLGKCVQMIPHVTEEIKTRIQSTLEPDTDVAIIEVGGTVGDIESTIFLEGIRQLLNFTPKNTIALVHVTLIPRLPGNKELKTKPTQHSVQKFKEIIGKHPDILLCRLQEDMTLELKKKLSLFTYIPQEAIIPAKNFEKSLYELPITYDQAGLSKAVLTKLSLTPKRKDTTQWARLFNTIYSAKKQTNIGLVGKYLSVESAYTSIYQALYHASFQHNTKVNIHLIDSEHLNNSQIHTLDGILVPGGFGQRGTPGKIKATQYARENNIPFLGICLGLQMLVIEYARNVLSLQQANSTEFEPHTPHPVIDLLASQAAIQKKGGTMRLGTYTSQIVPQTLLHKIYDQATFLHERHRHRYEVNNVYLEKLVKNGLIISSITPQNGEELVEAVEWGNHPFGIAVQFHPEFKSTPFKPHPLFSAFVEASTNKK